MPTNSICSKINVQWDIYFIGNNNLEYHWYGEFETKKIAPLILDDGENEKDKFKIINEVLSIDGKILIERNDKEIKFKNQPLPKLSPFQSAVSILSEEEDISPVQDSFNKIIYSDQSGSVDAVHPKITIVDHFKDLEDTRVERTKRHKLIDI